MRNPASNPYLTESFEFTGWDADRETGRVRLRYAFADGQSFCEVIDFGAPLPAAGTLRDAGFRRAVDALHVAAGISYYKATLAPKMTRPGKPFSPAEQRFYQNLYENGLGEFSARNNIAAWDYIRFPADTQAEFKPAACPAGLPRCSAVAVGGGKDSLVSIECLRAAGEPMVLFAVNAKKPILECAEKSGLKLITVTRTLDAKLFALNEAGALNGHIPITAIVSLIALAGAFVHGYDRVILSNERSANEGNMVFAGRTVNHQFSKTLAFETMLGDFVRDHIAPDLQYVSLLRPLSEFHIARLFARHDRYDDVFTSCNRAFVLRPQGKPVHWCCDCPKCRFAFLILATAMGPERLTCIFGKNLLDDPAQTPGYEELAGLTGHKPWECVGEIAESSAALLHLADDPRWREMNTVAALTPALSAHMPDYHPVEKHLLTPTSEHRLPEDLERALHAYLG